MMLREGSVVIYPTTAGELWQGKIVHIEDDYLRVEWENKKIGEWAGIDEVKVFLSQVTVD